MSDNVIDNLLPTVPVSSGFTPSTPPAEAQPQPVAVNAAPLNIRVVWGDLVRVAADIHVTGHYRGVLPVAAEAALDAAISGDGPGIVAEHTRRRWLGGSVGEITYFPSGVRPDRADLAVKCAAVAGMGRVGTFTEARAELLYASLLHELTLVPSISSAALVPIGSGAGNLTVAQVASAMVKGFENGIRQGSVDHGLSEIVVVEVDRLRAENLLRALREAARRSEVVHVCAQLSVEPDGRLGTDAAAVLAIQAMLAELRKTGGETLPTAASASSAHVLDTILTGVDEALREPVRRRLMELTERDSDVYGVMIESRTAEGKAESAPDDYPTPTRVTVLRGTTGLIWSAATARATVPEREVAVNDSIVRELVARLSPPSSEDAEHLPTFLTHFMVPEDLRAHLTGEAATVIEVDPSTASVPWEFLVPNGQTEGVDEALPLAVRQCFARQMRTGYARTDVDDFSLQNLRALVIGDPGDPGRGESLPQARTEAVEVYKVLQAAGIETTLFVGAPESTPTPHARPAARLDVMARLLSGVYDIIHYAGHGVFEPGHPELAGWLFADGLLAARELTQLSRAPRLVLANACWSARRPDSPDAAPPDPRRGGELAPVLADEFLRVGVGHFIGASWRVPDGAAATFATTFHRALIGSDHDRPQTVGQALREARRRLWDDAHGGPQPMTGAGAGERLAAWAAYQHYGDPSDRLLKG